MRRRALLTALATGGTTAIAGCSSGGGSCELPPSTVDRPRDRWPTAGYVPTNTAYAPAGPAESTVQWLTGRDEGDGEYLIGYFSTPLVGDGQVYTAMLDYDLFDADTRHDESGFVVAFDDETGTEAWRLELPRLAGGSPSLAGDRLFVGDSGGGLHAISTDGEFIWTKNLGAPARGCTVAGSTLYVIDNSGAVHGFTLDGDRCWQHDPSSVLDGILGGESYAVNSAPAVDASGVYATVHVNPNSRDDRTARVLAFDHGGSQRWHYDFPASYQPPNTPTVVDGTVVATAGNQIHAIDAESGDRQWRFVTGHDHTGAPATDGDRVYVGAKNLYALSLSDGTEQWRVVNEATEGSVGYENGAPFMARPAVTDDAVYLRAGAFDPEDGSRLWGDFANEHAVEDGVQRDYGWRPMVSPSVTADALYLAHQTEGVLKLA
ncbi:PQQ-binding-like beta-propeller repeat protein [Haloarchaeobius sp. HME9146]|uniref:PQQ-binding-like beta-propeller repeat protein n=1 Tax=Haloarchaeobius sp. HME9146 TaxID=2978732 RepID=UPI0021C21C24|nr:PQQ-binding-like beta-propeller repeat protein [Haloarchaeobius sp. HME9146]MCT9097039.1 PQQ-like beta-propeller repeat protein [Haloarchaeobius sp. HME9146]